MEEEVNVCPVSLAMCIRSVAAWTGRWCFPGAAELILDGLLVAGGDCRAQWRCGLGGGCARLVNRTVLPRALVLQAFQVICLQCGNIEVLGV